MVLFDYCDIQKGLPKRRRRERHGLFLAWLAKPYELPGFAELTCCIDWADCQQIPLSPVFQKKAVNPVFDREIFEFKNVAAMKRMLLRFRFGNGPG